MKSADRKKRLWELAGVFLKLGVTAYGGPAAHIAMMQQEAVDRRRWLSQQSFLDLIGATNLIPGPNSTEMAIHLGRMRAGWPGLLVAGSCFILPAVMIVSVLAWAYASFGTMPQAEWLLYGVKPVIIVVVVQALWGLGRKAVKNGWLGLLGGVGAALGLAGLHELMLLFGSGILVWVVRSLRAWRQRTLAITPLFFTLLPALTASAPGDIPFSLARLFWVFVKIGSVLFGSGYVLLAFLRADLIDRLQWLTEGQLIDAVAIGQVTPGPVFTTATFVGYLLGGASGAVVATVGIFLPAFFFVAVSAPLIPRLRASKSAGAFLDGVNVGSLALMAVVTFYLAHAAFVDVPTVVLGVVSAVLLLRYRISSTWLVLGGALGGLLSMLWAV